MYSRLNDPHFSTVHFIWLGSPLRYQDVARIREWAALNPKKNLQLWCQPEFAAEIKRQLTAIQITVTCLDELDVPNNLKCLIQKLIEPREDNLYPQYSAVADIYKAIILDQCQGWYADVGDPAFNIDKVILNPLFNFMIVAMRKGETLLGVNMGAMASAGNSVLAKNMLNYFNLTADEFSKECNIVKIRSNVASIRLLATMLSTGFALKAALSGIFIQEFNDHLIHCFDDQHNLINKSALGLFDSLIREPCAENSERTWISSGNIVIDQDYLTSTSGSPQAVLVDERITLTHCKDIMLTDISAVRKLQENPARISLKDNMLSAVSKQLRVSSEHLFFSGVQQAENGSPRSPAYRRGSV